MIIKKQKMRKAGCKNSMCDMILFFKKLCIRKIKNNGEYMPRGWQ